MVATPIINNDGQAVDITVVEPGSADDPFVPGNPAVTSQAPSAPAGAPAEPAVPKANVEPAPAPTPSPAPSPATAAPAPATAAVPPEPVADPEPAATAPTQTEQLAQLAEWGDGLADQAQRSAQSVYDRAAAKQTTQVEGLTQQVTDMRNTMRASQISELETDEEKEELRQKFISEDGNQVLDARKAELDDYWKFLCTESYALEYNSYGVTPEALEQFTTPPEMEVYCLEQKATHFEQLANGPAPTAPVTAVAPAAPAPAPVANAPVAPAAATAPTDPASAGSDGTPPQPNIGRGPAAMRTALAALQPEIVK